MQQQPNQRTIRAEVAELDSTMAANREGYLAYEHAHAELREATKKRKAKGPARQKKDLHREAHRLYWRSYERRRALRKQYPDLFAGEAGQK